MDMPDFQVGRPDCAQVSYPASSLSTVLNKGGREKEHKGLRNPEALKAIL